MISRILAIVLVVMLMSTGAAVAQEEIPVEPEEKLTQEEQIEKNIEDLSSDSWAIREAATKALIELGLPAAKEVAKLVGSEDMEIRVRAKKILEALHYITEEDKKKIEDEIDLCRWGGSPKEAGEEIKKLIEELSSDDWQVREDAAKKLVEKGLDALRPVAKLAKETEDPDLKDKLERAVKEIREKAKEQFEGQFKKSIEALKEIKGSSYHIIELLKKKGEQEAEKIKSRLLAGILDITTGNYADGPIVIKQNGGQGAVIKSTVIIMRNGKRQVIINGEDVTGIGQNPTPEKILTHIAKDEKQESDLREEAVKTLSEREATKAVEELVKLIEKSSGKLQLETAKALRKLTGQEFGPTGESTLEDTQKAMDEWKKWWEENKENEKYRFGELTEKDDNDQAAGAAVNPKALEEMMKKMQKLTKDAAKEAGKKADKKEENKKEDDDTKKKEDNDKKEKDF